MIEIKIDPENRRFLEIWVEGDKWKAVDKGLYKGHLHEISRCRSKEECTLFFSKKERQIALGYAYYLLSRRGYLKRELEEKLKAKKISDEVIQEILLKCEKQGYLDDRREISLFVKRRIERGEGPLMIAMQLRRKGKMAGEEARDCVRRLFADGEQEKQIEKWMKKRYHHNSLRDLKERQRAYRFLRGKGFDEQLVRKVLL